MTTATPAVPALKGTSHLSRDAVLRALDEDESNGHAVAAFRIGATQRAWQPDDTRPHLTGPGVVLYERQFGRVTGWKA